MKSFVAVTVMCYLTGLGSCDNTALQTYNYEKKQNYGLGNRIIPNFRRLLFGPLDAFPEPMPTKKVPFRREPYTRIKQGKRRYGDSRIFKKEFMYPASTEGHRIMLDNMFDCKITYMSIDTERGIPIILRGGAGYSHFTVIVRAKPGDPLSGTITAYCRQKEEDTLPPKAATRSWRFPPEMFNLTGRRVATDDR